MAVLTRRQREIFDFVKKFVDARGYAPSLEEIGGHFGLSSVATVHRHVELLTEKGFPKKAANSSRAREPVAERRAQGEGFVDLPLLGCVAAGAPIEVFEDAEAVAVPAGMVRRPAETFVLRVRGDSMI